MKKNKMIRVLAEVGIFLSVLFVAGSLSGWVDLSGEIEEKNPEAVVVEIDEKQFTELIYDINSTSLKYLGDKPVIVDFYAVWCGPCKRLRPRLEQIAKEYGDDIIVYSIDAERAPKASQFMGIDAFPTLFFIPTEGKPARSVGLLKMGELRHHVDKYLLNKE